MCDEPRHGNEEQVREAFEDLKHLFRYRYRTAFCWKLLTQQGG